MGIAQRRKNWKRNKYAVKPQEKDNCKIPILIDEPPKAVNNCGTLGESSDASSGIGKWI